MSADPNLVRHMADVVAKLTSAELRGNHMHASVQYGPCGEAYSGPVTEWDYIREDEEGFGFLELINYKGEAVRKPLVRVGLHGIRPCWDRGCFPGKPARPAAAPLREETEYGHDPYAGTGFDGE